MFLTLMVLIVVGVLLAGAGVDVTGDTGIFVATAVGQTIALIAALWWLRLRGALSWHLLGPLRPRWRHLPVGVGLGLAGWLLVWLVVALIVLTLEPDQLPTQETIERVARGGGGTLVAALLVAGVLAPILEELIYRAVLFQALRARLGLFPGMFISAFVFAGGHLELIIDPETGGFMEVGLIGMFGLAIFGIWLAGMFHRTGSLVVPVAAHASFNLVSLGLTYGLA